MMVHLCNPSTWEAEDLKFKARIYTKTLSQKIKKQKKNNLKEERFSFKVLSSWLAGSIALRTVVRQSIMAEGYGRGKPLIS
jgi:hypothetical protein